MRFQPKFLSDRKADGEYYYLKLVVEKVERTYSDKEFIIKRGGNNIINLIIPNGKEEEDEIYPFWLSELEELRDKINSIIDQIAIKDVIE